MQLKIGRANIMKVLKIKPKKVLGSLNIFDIDNTLFRTTTNVHVVDAQGNSIKKLTSAEYNSHKLEPGHKYDYTEFRSGKHFYDTAKPIESMIDKAHSIVGNSTELDKTIIVTARSDFHDKDPFLETFRKHGFPIDKVFVERAGNLSNLDSSMGSHILKGVIIKKYLNTGYYDKVRMWDDHKANLRVFLKLKAYYPKIKFYAYLVDPNTGRVKKYEE